MVSINEAHRLVDLLSDKPSKGPYACCEFIEFQVHVTVLQTSGAGNKLLGLKLQHLIRHEA
ncbi:MAG: hypothetical protein ABI568_15575 [Pseudarthrobacter sp.]